jgi:hypothetical protein
MAKSDIPVYFWGVLLGICAGLLDIRLNDLLVTAIAMMLSAFALGYLRPQRAWRWILVIAPFVPLVRLAAYLALGQRSDRAQIWESGLGFVTGLAGAYSGALARKGVDELFRSR